MKSQIFLNRFLFQNKNNPLLISRSNLFQLCRPVFLTQQLKTPASLSLSNTNGSILNTHDKPHSTAVRNLFEGVNPVAVYSSPLFSSLLYSNKSKYRYYTIRSGPGYTKFGHAKAKLKFGFYGYFWCAFLAAAGLSLAFVDFDRMMYRGDEPVEKYREVQIRVANNTRAKEVSNDDDDDHDIKRSNSKKLAKINNQNDDESEGSDESGEEDEDGKNDSKKTKITFRNRKIIEYENRIRQYSTPDKVFRYFSTIKIWNPSIEEYEIFMTPDDFVRSFTYGVKQPDGLGLDSYNKFDPNMQKLDFHLNEDSIFKSLGQNGLISFSDYVFLTTLLSTPTRHFKIAFQMFDTDGNGNIDMKEFEEVILEDYMDLLLQGIIRSQTSIGQRHRDTRMTGSVLKDNKTLKEYFFGKDWSEDLTVERFTQFQKKLQSEVMSKEFELCNPKTREDGVQVISETAFGEVILAYAGLTSKKNKKVLKKISATYGSANSKGISYKDYEDFFEVLRSINDIDIALKFYAIAGAPIDKNIFKHVSKTVAGVNLSHHVIDVIFDLFDDNGDGKLSHKEFIKVMKKRLTRGLQMPKDTGFVKLISAVSSCVKETVMNSSS